MTGRARRLLLAAVTGAALTVVVFGVVRPYAARSHLVAVSDLRRVDGRLYVDPDWSAATVRDLERALVAGRARVGSLFGSPARARPVVIAVDAPERALQYMENLHGATHATPFATIVVLGPEGRSSVDVIAHELVHAEHVERAGWLRYLLAPMWFTEGLGMQVDHRERYDDAAWAARTADGARAPALDVLARPGGFRSGDATANYAHARREVSRWLSREGPDGLADLLAAWRFRQRYAAASRRQ
jgi:hypothetical protein